jgi:glycerophosphoryl diester phosphodiesterase
MMTVLKYLLIFISTVILVYFVFAFIEGGFGKKATMTLPRKSGNSMLLFAHRGVVTRFPENSREAIQEAKLMGFEGLETDIRRTSDGEFILFHDGTAERLLGVEKKISEMTLQQIKQLSLYHNGDNTSVKVITLKDMLDEYKDDFVFYFDMKLGCFKDVDDLVSLVMTEGIHESVIVASPSFLVSLYIEFRYPSIQTAMEGFDAGKEWVYYLIPKNLKPDFLSGFASKVDEDHVGWLQKKGLLSNRIVYGVDSADYQEIVDLGVKNMIIDYFSTLQTYGP